MSRSNPYQHGSGPRPKRPSEIRKEQEKRAGVKVVNVFEPIDFTKGQPSREAEQRLIDHLAKRELAGGRGGSGASPDDLSVDSGDKFLDELSMIADEDVHGLKVAQASYGNSWKSRGGVGAFMMLARKWDRLENRVKRPAGIYNRSRSGQSNVDYGIYDLFGHLVLDQRAEGVIDDVRDLRRYLLLVEAEMRARGFNATHRDNKP